MQESKVHMTQLLKEEKKVAPHDGNFGGLSDITFSETLINHNKQLY
jgi:hypothetical protein